MCFDISVICILCLPSSHFINTSHSVEKMGPLKGNAVLHVPHHLFSFNDEGADSGIKLRCKIIYNVLAS